MVCQWCANLAGQAKSQQYSSIKADFGKCNRVNIKATLKHSAELSQKHSEHTLDLLIGVRIPASQYHFTIV